MTFFLGTICQSPSVRMLLKHVGLLSKQYIAEMTIPHACMSDLLLSFSDPSVDARLKTICESSTDSHARHEALDKAMSIVAAYSLEPLLELCDKPLFASHVDLKNEFIGKLYPSELGLVFISIEDRTYRVLLKELWDLLRIACDVAINCSHSSVVYGV